MSSFGDVTEVDKSVNEEWSNDALGILLHLILWLQMLLELVLLDLLPLK